MLTFRRTSLLLLFLALSASLLTKRSTPEGSPAPAGGERELLADVRPLPPPVVGEKKGVVAVASNESEPAIDPFQALRPARDSMRDLVNSARKGDVEAARALKRVFSVCTIQSHPDQAQWATNDPLTEMQRTALGLDNFPEIGSFADLHATARIVCDGYADDPLAYDELYEIQQLAARLGDHDAILAYAVLVPPAWLSGVQSAEGQAIPLRLAAELQRHDAEAVALLNEMARRRDARAFRQLGIMALNGRGMAQDPFGALVYFRASEMAGTAAPMIDELSALFDEEQLAQVELQSSSLLSFGPR